MSQGTAKPKNRARETGGNLEKLLATQQIEIAEALQNLLIEARVQTYILASGLNVRDDLDQLRDEFK